jgi:uncharacterized protein YodC (DUF2158 family)
MFSDSALSAVNKTVYVSTGTSINPSTNTITTTNLNCTTVTATNFTGTASIATEVKLIGQSLSALSHFLVYATQSITTSSATLYVGTGISFVPSTNTLTVANVSSSGTITCGTFAGTATTANNIKTQVTATAAANYITFVPTYASNSSQSLYTNERFFYVPSTEILTVTNISSSGTITCETFSGTATTATRVTVSNIASNLTYYLTFTPSSATTNSSQLYANSAISCNPSTGLITCTRLVVTNAVNLATNLSLGSPMALPYQSASNTTSFLAAGTDGQILRCNGSSPPSWTTQTGFSVNFAGNATLVGNYLSPGRYYDTTWASVTSSSNFTKWISPTSVRVNAITFIWSVGSATATMSVRVAGVVVYTTGTIFGTAGNTVVSGLNITLTSGQTLEISLNVQPIGYVLACMYLI